MKSYPDLKSAINDLPVGLVGSSCDDEKGIAAQARQDCENPLAILRDLVRTEIDLLEEGETSYCKLHEEAIREYFTSLRASC